MSRYKIGNKYIHDSHISNNNFILYKIWEYEEHAKRLASECEKLGLDYYIKEYPDTGDWLSNTRLKAKFIYETLEELKRPVLWIDVDGSIYRKPNALMLPITADFMARHQRTGPMRTWHVGTMFFNYTESARHLVNFWKELTDAAHGTDEAAFEYVWDNHSIDLDLIYEELPAEYFHIIARGNHFPNTTTVISHRLSKCETKMARKQRQQSQNDS